jgi:hypothetical protein
MNRIKTFALCLLLLSACISYQDSNLRWFIIGRWKGEFLRGTGNSTYLVKYELEFLPFNLLLVDITGPEDGMKGSLSYQFVKENKITIKGRIIDEDQIGRTGQDLTIESSIYGFPPNGRYKRIPSVLEWIVVILLAGITLLVIIKFTLKRKVQTQSNGKNQKIE